ncbi:MAG: (2Fe-2S)-binding protein, partial [Deltaproteobacteria bacterium]|nr:(2Fe-2S)-binding protein [Deltaproteobacteria bacterium]
MAKIPAIVEGLIDGRQIAAEAGTTILEACRQNGIGVPTLCHHEGLEAEGGCRLCLVEMDGKLLASCQYPLRSSGFKVLTMSDEVKRARRLVIALMLTRAPDSKVVLDLARAYGVRQDPRLNRSPADGCLRCGRCVRACAAAGGEAISLVGRGAGRRVMGPFD